MININKEILESISDFSDLNFQRRSWFGVGPEVSSPEEMCNRLYDLDIVNWLKENQNDLGPFLVQYIENFLKEVEKLPDNLDPWEIYSSNEWHRINSKANVIKDLLQQKVLSD